MIEFTIQDERTELQTTKERTREGFLRARANITKVGVCTYEHKDVAKLAASDPSLPTKIGVYRPIECLSTETTKNNVKLKPITYKHPHGGTVTPENYRTLARGHIGEVRLQDDGHLQAELLITDPDLINKIEQGDMEVSIGTNPQRGIVREDGVHNGTPYQYRITSDLDINHVAVVEKGKGRAGPTVKILDSKEGVKKMDEEEIKKLIQQALADALPDKEEKKSIDEGKIAEAIAASVKKVFEEQAQKLTDAKEAEEKATKDKEEAEQRLNDSVHDRVELLANCQAIMSKEDFDKLDTKATPEVIMRDALGANFDKEKKMSAEELKGAFKVVVAQRLSDSTQSTKGLPTDTLGYGNTSTGEVKDYAALARSIQKKQ